MLKKTLVNCFLMTWVAVMFIDVAPETCDFHRTVKGKLDRYLDAGGVWQGAWKLFAPNPDSFNGSITADIGFADGKRVVLKSPEWRKLSAWERFKEFREAEFVDGMLDKSNSCAWSTYAAYLQRTVSHPTNPDLKPTEVVLIRDWVDIAPPNEFNIKEFPDPPEMTSTFVFFAEEYLPESED